MNEARVYADGFERSFAEVKERTDDFLKWLVGQEEYEDKNILLVTHGVALAT